MYACGYLSLKKNYEQVAVLAHFIAVAYSYALFYYINQYKEFIFTGHDRLCFDIFKTF